MILKIKHFVIFITFGILCSCKENPIALHNIEATEILIDSTLVGVDSIDSFVAPYRKRINQVLDSALAYAPITFSKTDGVYNSTAGNLMADIIFEQSNPIFKSRTGKSIDFVLLNHGGIRADISKGKVTARTAYEIMPFENTVVVVELSGKSVSKLVDYLIKSNRAHPISKGLQVILNKNGTLQQVKVNGKPLDENQNYNVATSNYLVTGGDNMGFFRDGLEKTETDYLIRNAIIDYFKKVDTLRAKIDDRYFIVN